MFRCALKLIKMFYSNVDMPVGYKPTVQVMRDSGLSLTDLMQTRNYDFQSNLTLVKPKNVILDIQPLICTLPQSYLEKVTLS